MSECNSPQDQQNQKYRKQLKRFSLEFKQGDLREFYHLLFEQCSHKLFNTAMIFKLIILTTFTIGEFIYFEDEIVSAVCLVCLFLFFILWFMGYKMRHQVPTTFRICHVLLSMIMYILVMQIQDSSEDDIIKNVKQSTSSNISDYDFQRSKLAAFFSMLFSLYQIVYIQIEIKWFFRASHFFFIILLNWLILGVNEFAIIYGVIYFLFIVILLYQFEVTKKENSFQMYRVIEDFQSLKTLINDILPMQIFIVQRNSLIPKSMQQRMVQNNASNNDTHLNQNIISNQSNINAMLNQEDGSTKQDQQQMRLRQISAADKDSICINGISTAYASNKKTIDLRSLPNENTQQRRKDSNQSATNRNQNNPSVFSKQKQHNLNQSGNAINSVVNNATDPSVTPIGQSIQSINNAAQQNKNIPSKLLPNNIEEAKSKNRRQSVILQTQENEENNYTEHLATNPPLISKNDGLLMPSTRVCYHSSGINNGSNRQQHLQNQLQINPLKIAFANKLIHQDLQSSTLDDILKELTNIQLPLNSKNNNINQSQSTPIKKNSANGKVLSESLHDALFTKLYRSYTQVVQSQNIYQNTHQNNINIAQSSSIAGQFLNQQQNMQASITVRGNNGNNQQINTSNGVPINFAEEVEAQNKFLNLPSHRSQQNYQKSPFSQTNGPIINGGFQDTLQKKTTPLQVGNITGGFGGQSEIEYNNNNGTIYASERGRQASVINNNTTTNNNNQWNSVHRFGNQTGLGNESLNGNIPNESGIFNSQNNYQQLVQQLLHQQQHFQHIQSNQNHLNNDNLNMYNYIPQCRINKVWEYHNCFFKKNNIAQNNLNNGSIINGNTNNTRRVNNIDIIGSQNQQEEDKNYDIKLVECKWEGEESIMVIMNNINERLMRERLLQIEQYKDTMIDTISHNLKTPLNCILAPLESIKLMLEQQQEEQNLIESKYKKSAERSNSRFLMKKNTTRSIVDDEIGLNIHQGNQMHLSTPTSEIVKQVSMAINNCQLLLYMINDMIDYSEIIKGENCFRFDVDYFKINYITKTLNNLFQDQMQSKKIEFKITQRIDISESILLHDQRRILQILVNLISNSLKFTLKGKVELIIDNPSDDSAQNTGQAHHYQFHQAHTQKFINSPSSNRNKQQFLNAIDSKSVQSVMMRQQPKIQESLQSNNQNADKIGEKKKTIQREKHIRFTVIDSGIGMPPYKLQKLKRMLFRKERSHTQNSSGLGLTMCYSLIKQIGCQHTHLDIQSEENHGSSFSFTIQQFYKNSSHSPVAPTNTNFQSATHLQKHSSFAQLVNGLTVNTNLPQSQPFGNFEIKEESLQTKISPLLHKDTNKDELNINLPTFTGLQISKLNSQQVLKQQSSSHSVLNKHTGNLIISNLSNLHTKTTLENQNAVPKTINTICNDEHILDTSTEEREAESDKNKVKTNNNPQPTKLNYKQNHLALLNQTPKESNNIQKEQKTLYSAASNNFNNSPTNNSLMNQELSNALTIHNNMIQKSNTLQVNMNLSNSKNSKMLKQVVGPQSLNQFSMVSLTPNRQDKSKKKGHKKNLKELNTMYSSITQRHTMIFGKSLKSDAFENEDYDIEHDEDDQNFENSIESEEVENYDEEYFNTDNSIKHQFSCDKKGKNFLFKSEHISHNIPDDDFQDIINENNLPQTATKEPEIELEYIPTNPDEGESKKSKPLIERRAFPTFGEADFNLKKFMLNQGIPSSTSVNQKEKEQKTNAKNDQQINSPLSSHDATSSDHVSENKDQIQTQKYHFSAPSRNLDLFSSNMIFDNIIESRHHSIKLEQIALLQDTNDNQLSDQDLFNSNVFLPQLQTEKNIQQTLEMILDSKHILVVDDTIYNIVSLKIFFRNVKDLQIEEAYNGRDALEKYQENAINGVFFDYIFMDIEMPIMDGLECIKHIREFEIANGLKKTIIITVTAYEREQQEVKMAGANALIAKPIQKDKFLQTLRYLASQNH